MRNMTREQRRYWKRETIKAAISLFALPPLLWLIVESIV